MFLSTAVSSLASMIRSVFKGFCSGGWSCFGTEFLACWVDFGILKLSYIPHLDRPIKFLLCAQNSMVLSKVGMLVMLVTTAHPHADTLHVPDPCVWMLLVNPLILLYLFRIWHRGALFSQPYDGTAGISLAQLQEAQRGRGSATKGALFLLPCPSLSVTPPRWSHLPTEAPPAVQSGWEPARQDAAPSLPISHPVPLSQSSAAGS